MNCWEILGMVPTEDVRVIKRQFAQLVKTHRPDGDLAAYQRIRDAYEQALAGVADIAMPDDAHSVEDTQEARSPEIRVEERSSNYNRVLPENRAAGAGFPPLPTAPLSSFQPLRVVPSDSDVHQRTHEILDVLLDENSRLPEQAEEQLLRALAQCDSQSAEMARIFEMQLLEMLNLTPRPWLTLSASRYYGWMETAPSSPVWDELSNDIGYYNQLKEAEAEIAEIISGNLYGDLQTLLYQLGNATATTRLLTWLNAFALEIIEKYAHENYSVIDSVAQALGWNPAASEEVIFNLVKKYEAERGINRNAHFSPDLSDYGGIYELYFLHRAGAIKTEAYFVQKIHLEYSVTYRMISALEAIESDNEEVKHLASELIIYVSLDLYDEEKMVIERARLSLVINDYLAKINECYRELFDDFFSQCERRYRYLRKRVKALEPVFYVARE